MGSRYYQQISIWLFILAIFLCVGKVDLHAQQPLGGPYESDSATVLLMHFDGNLSNASDFYHVAEPRSFGSISFQQLPGAGDLNQQIRFQNGTRDNKSHIQVPGTTSLDLQGNWTMELWINMFGPLLHSPWKQDPWFFVKPAIPDTTDPPSKITTNYRSQLDFALRSINSGYHEQTDSSATRLHSDANLMRIGEWYHITFMRDTSRQVLVQLIHQNANEPAHLPEENDDPLTLIDSKFHYYGEDEDFDPPLTSDLPLYIGGFPRPDTTYGYFDGFIDELRISNVVRDYEVPPSIDSVSRHFPRHPKDTPIRANILNVGENQIEQVTLHYREGDMNRNFESWQQKQMQPAGSNIYDATISKQPVGSIIQYYVEARNQSGLTTIKPHRAMQDSNYYNYAVWDDSTTILEMTFEGFKNGERPRDTSQYSNPLTVHGGEARYGSGEEQDDQALEIPADQPYYIQTESPFLHFKQFTLSLQFIADGRLPDPGTRLLAKQTESPEKSNFQVWIDTNGVVVPDAYVVNGGKNRHVGSELRINDAPIQPDQWYELKYRFSTMGDTAFAELRTVADDQTIAETGAKVTGIPYRGSGPLLIGTGDPETDRYWNGRIDEVQLKNYCDSPPPYYIQDCVSDTKINIPESSSLPNEFILHPNHPNPFNPTTQIEFSLPRVSDVKLAVYDMLGRRVTTLVDGKRQAGQHSVTFNAGKLSSGVYIYRLKAEEISKSRKMLLVK